MVKRRLKTSYFAFLPSLVLSGRPNTLPTLGKVNFERAFMGTGFAQEFVPRNHCLSKLS